ncbi:hypothetical protein [Bradyrhizobium prioriisuperbiae]|uniref:hypothetical protein n=1 Tax=Bradyrhizobium prioriisuperbiae TaxID=2854389 RepID=UPI0028E439F7|nr:hypothetical protein [Bradyrhizobium prioritasuperba]
MTAVGLGLDALSGQALFVGPTFYMKFNDRAWMAAAWGLQVWGRTSHATFTSLDLSNFERAQAVLRFGYNF